MEQHFKRAHREQFVYEACKLCQKECRTEVYNDHIKNHNNRGRGSHFMDPDELDKLLISSSNGEALVALTAVIEKQQDFEKQYFSRQCGV